MAHVRAYGDMWVVDQREGSAPIDVYSLNEREPNLFQWLWLDDTEPVRSLATGPDPWLTWEWRTHLGQQAAWPAGEPATMDEMRIAHNVALAQGDAAAAQRWRRGIESQLDRSRDALFTGGLHLIGTRTTGGVQPRVESWFEAAGPTPGEATFGVRSTIEASAPLSLIPPDRTDREMASAPSLPTKLWRPGYLYRMQAVLNHRIGRERYWGYWSMRGGGPPPARIDGQLETTLAIVP